MSKNWTKDFKNQGGQWPSEDSAQEVADSLQDRIGHFEHCGTLKAVTVCRISTKPASDPGFEVWGVRARLRWKAAPRLSCGSAGMLTD